MGAPSSQTRTGLQWELELHGGHRTSSHVCGPEAGGRPQVTGNPRRSRTAERVSEERALRTEGEGRPGPTARLGVQAHTTRGVPRRGLSAGSTSGLVERAGPRQKHTFSAGLRPEAETQDSRQEIDLFPIKKSPNRTETRPWRARKSPDLSRVKDSRRAPSVGVLTREMWSRSGHTGTAEASGAKPARETNKERKHTWKFGWRKSSQ